MDGCLVAGLEDISKDRVFALAGGVAYYGLLALFPAIAALVALYGLFADPTTIVTHLDSLSGVLPGGGIEVLRDELDTGFREWKPRPKHYLPGGVHCFPVER